MISVNPPKSQHRTHTPEVIHFLYEFLICALHTEVHSLCDFSESAELQAPRTPGIIHSLMNSLCFTLHTEIHSLCDFSESVK